jgi:O-antigen ligase/predicted TPR repeat methyltransferase
MPSTSLGFERYAASAAVVLTCVLFLPTALDPVNVVKLTALLVTAVVLVVAVTARVLKERVVRLPRSPVGVATVALVLGLLVSAAMAPVTTTAVLGAPGRESGLLAYLAGTVLLLVGLRAFDRTGAHVLVGAVVLAGAFTATYGLLQWRGIDAIGWSNPFNPIIAALGNPNFASGYLGIAASVAVGGALYAGWSRAWRVAAALTGVLCLTAAALSASVQGPIAAAAGLTVVVLAQLLGTSGAVRKVGLSALGAAVLAGAALLGLGLVAQAGPAAPIFQDAGSRARGYYWQAALTMFRDQPLFGVGLDHYGSFYRTSRSEESLEFLAGTDFADAAHSVPLQMLAQGGALLGVAYLAFVLGVAAALVRGMVRLRGDARVLLAAVGSGWAAYQVQSFVSIDQVPLLVLHFALAGAVVAVSGSAGLREVRLPGALAPAPTSPNDARARRRAAATHVRTRDYDGTDLAVLGAVGLLAAGALYLGTGPLRASIAVKSGDQALLRGDGSTALASYEQAVDLVPGRALYWIRKGNLFDRVNPPLRDRAQEAYEQAVQADPRSVDGVQALARATATAGDVERSRALHRRAAALDPFDESTVVAAAEFELAHDGAPAAVRLLQGATERLPESAGIWATLGQARAVQGDHSAARSAFRRALALDPAQPKAKQGLTVLAG